jgi:8-amino-7-oxononanoate synthase
MTNKFQEDLEKRKAENALRSLKLGKGVIDLCSNDYLGFARSEKLAALAQKEFSALQTSNGSTGSRLLSGNSAYAEMLESELAAFHHAEAALIFNSGYDANLSLFSSIAKRGDTIIADELIHASMIDGIRLSRADYYRFRHNDPESLEEKLSAKSGSASGGKIGKGTILVAVESIYSMDGDAAPLNKIAELCERYNALLIVDEAHATGVFGEQGRGLVSEFELEKKVFARVHTFGKALGCHGAVVIGSAELRMYLINFSRPFIYSTALPSHSLCTIKAAHTLLKESGETRVKLHRLIRVINDNLKDMPGYVISKSAIHCVVIPGNDNVKAAAAVIQEAGFDVRPILHPTVPKGKERLRICLHAFNTEEEVLKMTSLIKTKLNVK